MQALRERVEANVVGDLTHAEATNQHAPDAIGSFRVLVLPRALIARARREDVHVMALADMLGDQPTRMLDTRADIRTIAWSDEGEFHRCSNTSDSTMAPAGSAFTTSAAGGQVRARRANQPGSGSMACVAGVRLSSSNISRYLRSMTGQL